MHFDLVALNMPRKIEVKILLKKKDATILYRCICSQHQNSKLVLL